MGLIKNILSWLNIGGEVPATSLWPDEQEEALQAARDWLATIVHELITEGLATDGESVPDEAIEQFMQVHFPGGWMGFWDYANEKGWVGLTDPEDTAPLPLNWWPEDSQ